MRFKTAASQQTGQGKRIGLLVVVLMLLAGSIGYNIWRDRHYGVRPARERISTFIVRWRCLDCGNEIEAPAGPGPKVCPKCDQAQMYAHFAYMCRTHGIKQVAVQYDQDDRIIQVKVEDGDWVPPVDAEGKEATRCPECGEPMAGVEAGRRQVPGEQP